MVQISWKGSSLFSGSDPTVCSGRGFTTVFGSSSGPFVLGKHGLLSSTGLTKQSVPHKSFRSPQDSIGLQVQAHCWTLVV